MPQRTVAMLLTALDKQKAWQSEERSCRQCGQAFRPVREKQEFCPGGVCRVAWWAEHQATEVHRCRCGRGCVGPDPAKCRRPECNGTLVSDGDGGSVCLLCNRPGESLEELRASVAPRRKAVSA